MKVNSIYSTFQGECNPFGIGQPVIFLRLQGCHLRCYKKTLGVLCDTPEALKKPLAVTELNSIFATVLEISKETGIKIITLTGGDPLWNTQEELQKLFVGLVERGFKVSIETSGTISWLPYSSISKDIFWVLDYKLQSSGVKNSNVLFKDPDHLQNLTEQDYIKFVIYDEADMIETISVVKGLHSKTLAILSVGAYWGGKLSTFEIFERLKTEGLLGNVTINMQTHKMAVSSNFTKKIPNDI